MTTSRRKAQQNWALARILVLGVGYAWTAYGITATPNSVTFNYEQGALLPNPVNIAIQNVVRSFTVSIATNPTGWLLVSPQQGTSTTVLDIAVDPRNLLVGDYLGIVTIADSGVSLPTSIQVHLSVTPGNPITPVVPSVTSSPGPGYIAHIADRGGWKTIITVLNLIGSPQQIDIRFWSDDGRALGLQVAGMGIQTALALNLAANGSASIETDGDPLAQVVTGWASVASAQSPGSFGAAAIFRRHLPPQPDAEASSPMTANEPVGY
jgi:hypothetical protein